MNDNNLEYRATDRKGIVLCVSKDGYLYIPSFTNLKENKDFEKFKLKIKCNDFIGADIFTDPWNDDTSIIFASDQGLKYVSWAKPKNRSDSKADNLIKKTVITENQSLKFSVPKYISGSSDICKHKIFIVIDECFALCAIDNQILKWRTTSLQNKAFNGYKTHLFFKI